MRRCLNCMEEYADNYEACPHCGFIDGVTQNGGINLQPGTILQGRYIVGTIIKARETDVFYIGWDALFDRKVQIQEYFPRYCAARSGTPQMSVYDSKQERFEEGLELFIGHSRQLIRLYKEEDVITYHACFTENGTAYAIMDYQPCQTLGDKLEGQQIRIRDAQKWLYEAAEAVEKAHQIGVCHGQVGMDAFWVRPGGGLVLKDFGAARYISGEPGIVDYGRVGYGTDVYGLAKMFCQMIVGQEIEDEEKLEAELIKKQVSLKKTEVEALKAALRHQTDTVQRFCQGMRGERHIFQGSRKKKWSGKSLRTPRWIKVTAAVLLIGLCSFTGLVAAGVIPLRFNLGRSRVAEGMVRVPNVTNKDADKMEKELARVGLVMSRERMEYSKEIPQNRISYQSFKEGSQVPAGSVMEVCISMGLEKAVIPLVVGRSRADALELLERAGFTNVKVEESQKEGIYDTVLDIDQDQGANVELDQEIILTVCMNESSGDPRIQVQIPNVEGKGRDEAEKLLKGEGFELIWMEENSDQAEGVVLGQEPEAGKEANKGSYIKVRVSVGPEQIYMKNVQLLSEEEAKAAIEELGLTVGSVTEGYSDSVAAGKVISQSISQDAEVKKGDKVDLVISIGVDPAKPQPSTADPAAEADRRQQEEAARKQQEEAARKQQEEAAAAAEAQRQAEEAQRQAEAAAEAQRQAEAAQQEKEETQGQGNQQGDAAAQEQESQQGDAAAQGQGDQQEGAAAQEQGGQQGDAAAQEQGGQQGGAAAQEQGAPSDNTGSSNRVIYVEPNPEG